MSDSAVELGVGVRDRVTGFAGMVTGICSYISGCTQVLVVPKCGPDGSFRAGEWFDIQRVERDKMGPVLVLDNSATPGPDALPARRS